MPVMHRVLRLESNLLLQFEHSVCNGDVKSPTTQQLSRSVGVAYSMRRPEVAEKIFTFQLREFYRESKAEHYSLSRFSEGEHTLHRATNSR